MSELSDKLEYETTGNNKKNNKDWHLPILICYCNIFFSLPIFSFSLLLFGSFSLFSTYC